MNQTEPPGDALVIFGITGDLARRMTFRALYRLEKRDRLDVPVIGVGRNQWSDAELVAHARTALEGDDARIDEEVFARLAKRLTYVYGDYSDNPTYERLSKALGPINAPVFYLAIPPSLFATVVDKLAEHQLIGIGRVVVEKPFGHDLASAQQLSEDLHRHLDEHQLLRIDHFLGKEPVMDIQALRFANEILEPVWNRNHVSAVHITMAEDLGVEGRGSFFDAVGELRDVVQNHLMQVLALVAMEPPSGSDAYDVLDKKADVFRSMPDADPANYLRGQYAGYAQVEGVADGSTTETYVALKLWVDSWRWAGVPFLIRAGKGMATKATEVRVIFRRPPLLPFIPKEGVHEHNQVVLRIDPSPGLQIRLTSLGSGGSKTQPVHLDLPFEGQLGKPRQPYERLLDAALIGDHQLFSRQDGVDETWRILQPLLDDPPDPVTYKRGSWGPKQAEALVHGYQPWVTPWIDEPTETQ